MQAMAPHSSTLAWKIPWTEEPGGLQSVGLHRVGLKRLSSSTVGIRDSVGNKTASLWLPWKCTSQGMPFTDSPSFCALKSITIFLLRVHFQRLLPVKDWTWQKQEGRPGPGRHDSFGVWSLTDFFLETFLKLYCKLWGPSFCLPPPLLHQGQNSIMVSPLCHFPLVLSPYSLTGVPPNKFLACLILWVFFRFLFITFTGTPLMAQTVKNLPAIWQTRVHSLGGEDPLRKRMANHTTVFLSGEFHFVFVLIFIGL